jgi:penicillin-binding protein 1C
MRPSGVLRFPLYGVRLLSQPIRGRNALPGPPGAGVFRFFREKPYRLYGAGFGVLLLFFALSLPEPLFDAWYSPALLDREGKLLGALAAEDGQWRFPPGEGLNGRFAAALIEAEDRRFRYHPGVDPLALGRSLLLNLRRGRTVSGASTLTMQTIRLARSAAFRAKGRVLRRTLLEKAVEAVLAFRLELGFSKDEILALYAANAPFGANVVGLEAASWRWFGRSPGDLSWAEAALLASLPNSPALIHPGRNRDRLGEKRDALLDRLYRRGLFDGETLALARAEPLPGAPLPLPREAPHLLARLVEERGGLGNFNSAALRGGLPLRFESALEAGIQERARLIMERGAGRFAGNGIMNGACLIIRTATGECAAYVGNVASPSAGEVDLVRAFRSSGSLLKPFLYAGMLDSGDLLPQSLLSDIPTRVGSYSPENISRDYLGAVPADEALARSLNIPAVRSLRLYGVGRFARLLRDLGITSLFRSGEEYGLPLILGGAEVSLWEMTGLYAGLGRNSLSLPGEGSLFPPRLFPGEGPSPRASPLSPGAAWLALEALCFGSRPGEEAQWQDYAGARRIAWKTGTSFGFRDAWAIGVSPDWTVGVWVGNATGEGRAELRSALTSAPLLFELFSALGSGRGDWFSPPGGELKTLELCAFSGFPPGPDCSKLKAGRLPRGAPPARSCPYCRALVLDGETGRRVLLGAGSGGETLRRSWFVLPPAEEWYYRRWNLDYKPLPPFEGESPREAGAALPLALFNPEEGSQVLVPRELDGGEGRIVFSAAHREGGTPIHWHLDGEYLGTTAFFHELEARPPPGRHTLTLVDARGNTLSRRFTVPGTGD